MKLLEPRLHAKWPQVASEVRRRIVSGELPPGSRLPTRPQLSKQFGISEGTTQAVLDELSRARFIETRGRHGTFVTKHPPHLSHYGIAFPWEPAHENYWSKFHTAIRRAAEGIGLPPNCDSTIYVGAQEEDSQQNFQRLRRDVETDRVAGLIFATAPYSYQNTPVLDRPGIPRVAIMDEAEYTTMPRVYPDFAQWYRQAFDRIIVTGRRRVAVLLPTSSAHNGDGIIFHEAAARGLTIPRHWIQYAAVQAGEAPALTERSVQLLLSGHADERPDLLLITDDNLLEPAIEGIVAAGARVGHDVLVITHCNFPWPKTAGVPLIRLGFDVPAMVRLCVESITKQRQGEPVPATTLLPPVWEESL